MTLVIVIDFNTELFFASSRNSALWILGLEIARIALKKAIFGILRNLLSRSEAAT